MDLHQNARLTPHCRALLVQRVCAWSSAAAGCGGVWRQRARRVLQVGAAVSSRRRARSAGSLLPTAAQSAGDGARVGAGGAGVAPAAADAGGHCRAARAVAQHGGAHLRAGGSAAALASLTAAAARCSATSGRSRASCCTWTSRSSGASSASATASPAIGATRTGRAGWEFVHIAIDDTSRVAYAQVLPDEQGVSAWRSCAPPWPTTPASACPIREVLTDNGSVLPRQALRSNLP